MNPESVQTNQGAPVEQGGQAAVPAGQPGQPGGGRDWAPGWGQPERPPEVPTELRGMTQDDVFKAAQKGLKADLFLQESAQEKQRNAVARQFQDDVNLLTETGDPAAYRRAAATMGIPGDQVESALQEMAAKEAGKTQVNRPERPAAVPGATGTEGDWRQKLDTIQELVEKRKVDVNNLSPDLQELLGELGERRTGEIIEKAIDTDEVLRYHMGVSDDSGQEAIRNMVWAECERHLQNNTTDGRFGDGKAALKTAIPIVKTTLQALRSGPAIPPLSVGAAPGGGGDTFAIPPNTAPQRVRINAPGFDDYVTNVLEHNLRKLSAGGEADLQG